MELNDTWRIKNPATRRYTWRQKNPLIQCRLDYFLLSDSLYDSVVDIDTLPSVHTDHSAITLHIKHLPDSKHGPGHWKFNNSLLKDNQFTETLTNNIKEWIGQNEIKDKGVFWDYLKYLIRKFTIAYSKNKRKEIRCREKELENRLIILERNLSNPVNKNEYHEVKADLEQIEMDKIEGLIVQSRIQWHKQGKRVPNTLCNS